MDKNLKQRISLIEKLAYGFGDVGCGLIYVLSATYITFFYTDALGLNAAIIGTIIMFSKFADGISDILAGFIVDRTRSKYGKARAWVLRMTFPICISLILTVTVPLGKGTLTYAYVAVTYNLVNTICYTMMNVPYGTLNSLMTRDQGQRMVLNTFRMTMAQVGSMITNMLTIPFVNLVGGSSKQSSWIIVAAVYAVLALIMFVFCFKCTEERVTVMEEADSEAKLSFVEAFKLAVKNKYWVILVFAALFLITGQTVSGTVATYYAKYILNNENIVGVINALNFAPALILIPCLPKITEKIGKRNISLLGGILGVAGQALLFVNPESNMWIIICSLIKGIGSVMIMGTIFAMIADTIEYGEWKTGKRIEAVLYSAASFGTKVGGGIGGAVALKILGAAGYDGTAAVQTEAAMTAIRNIYLYVTLGIMIFIPILFALYKLDKIYPTVISDLLKKEESQGGK